MPNQTAEDLAEIKSNKDHYKPTPTEKLILGLVAVMVLGFLANIAVTQFRFETIERNQSDGRERTFQSRAVSCQVLLSLGQDDQTGLCDDREVMTYYDPTLITLTPTASITCDIARQLATIDPDNFRIPEGCESQ